VVKSEQESFWAGEFGNEYARRNAGFDPALEERAWNKMLSCLVPADLKSVLECGSNIGRNLVTLRRILPQAELSLIEINEESFKTAVQRVNPRHSFKGSILESNLPAGAFDLVFTSGVLIHIHPDNLEANCRKMVEYSRKYVLISEYFNRTSVAIDYRGEKGKLFKRDFGGFMMDHFPVRWLDYGFLWGREFDPGGFDDCTWWVFEKTGD
jgi:pseudaminic acid biosynthesis-associated methylase